MGDAKSAGSPAMAGRFEVDPRPTLGGWRGSFRGLHPGQTSQTMRLDPGLAIFSDLRRMDFHGMQAETP